MTRRLLARLKANAGRLIAVALVVGVFAFVLPRVADYGEVWDVVSGLSTLDLVALVAAAILNLLTFAPPWMAALPGLSFVHALGDDAGIHGGVQRGAGRRCRGHGSLVLDVAALGVPGRAGRRRHGRDCGLQRLRQRRVRGRRSRIARDGRRVAHAAHDRRGDRHRRARRRDRALRGRTARRRQRAPHRRLRGAALEPRHATRAARSRGGMGRATDGLPARGGRLAADGAGSR